MAKKKKSRSKPKPTYPLALLVPGAIGTISYVWKVGEKLLQKDWHSAQRRAIKGVIMYDIDSRTFKPTEADFTIGWGGGYIAHKAGDIIGINKALAKARVPYVRF